MRDGSWENCWSLGYPRNEEPLALLSHAEECCFQLGDLGLYIPSPRITETSFAHGTENGHEAADVIKSAGFSPQQLDQIPSLL